MTGVQTCALPICKRDAEREAIQAVAWSHAGPAPFGAAAHLDVLQLRAPGGDHFTQGVFEVDAATLTEGIVSVELRDVAERLPLGLMRRALTFFQHSDDQLFDRRIELSVWSLPAHRILHAGDWASPDLRA